MHYRLKNILTLLLIIAFGSISSQTNSGIVVLTIDQTTNKPVGLTYIEFYRNDSLIFVGTTNREGKLTMNHSYFPDKLKVSKLSAKALDFKQEDLTINQTTTFPIVIKFIKKKGQNITKKDLQKIPQNPD